MYGGSGTCPSASTSASRSAAPSGVNLSVRRPKKCRSRISALIVPAGPSNLTRAPGLSFWPGCTRASNSAAPSACRSIGGPSSRHSTAPPLGTRWPSRRAANTLVSFTTRRSPARNSDGRSPILRSLVSPVRRSSRQEARFASGRRVLRDRLVRQEEIEIRHQHGMMLDGDGPARTAGLRRAGTASAAR